MQITKYNFPRLLKEAWVNAMLSSNICAGFSNAGIYTLKKDKVRPTIENEELLDMYIQHTKLMLYMCTYLDDESDPPSIHDYVGDNGNFSCDSSDIEACSDECLENEELFNRRYEEGYNIYNESYAKWLLKNHRKETPTDWITQIEKGIFNGVALVVKLDIYVCVCGQCGLRCHKIKRLKKYLRV